MIGAGSEPQLYVRRVELRLARSPDEALVELTLDPDPLDTFARQMALLRAAGQGTRHGERAEICIDLLGVSGSRGRRMRRRMTQPGGDGQVSRSGLVTQTLAEAGVTVGEGWGGQKRNRMGAGELVAHRVEMEKLRGKVGAAQQMFEFQILLRVTSPNKARANQLMQALVSAFAIFRGHNEFRPTGFRVGDVAFLGANMPWRRWRFDQRVDTSRFAPRGRRNIVNSTEILGLLKPPTMRCASENVVRSGAYIQDAPQDLVVYKGQRGVLPLGTVRRDTGNVLIGMLRDDHLFSGLFGRSGHGKALSLDTPIPTPAGWSTMGKLREGDQVFDETGAPCRITAATPAMYEHECYEIEFDCGERIIADADHRWLTMTAEERRAREAGDLTHALTAADEPGLGGTDRRARPVREMPHVRTTRQIAATLLHGDAPNHSIMVAGALQYKTPRNPLPKTRDALRDALRWDGVSPPQELVSVDYRPAATRRREAVLRAFAESALATTSGNTTTLRYASWAFANDVRDLANGLGLIGSPPVPTPTASQYSVTWRHGTDGPTSRPTTPRMIVAVHPVESRPVRCIAVDSPSHLYLAGRACVPTHNTELALNILRHIAVVEGNACLFYDPHVDAITRLKPYLTQPGVRERVIELNLSRRSFADRHVSWNLLAMDGVGEEHLGDRSRSVVDSFMLAGGWTSTTHPRASRMLSNAVSSLLYLAMGLPADLQPTIFSLRALLTDSRWREAALPRLPERYVGYWTGYYEQQSDTAAGPILNLLDGLEEQPVVRATFGSPISTYSPRTAMDTNRIVLAAPPAVNDTLVASLLIQGHIDAARSRRDIPDELRKVCFWALDEVQTFDKGVGSYRGSALAEVLEQLRKFGVRVLLMAQSPNRLSDATAEALKTNASMLAVTATSAKGARWFSEEHSGSDSVRAIQQLKQWNYIVQITQGGSRVRPFALAGVPLERLASDRHPELLGELDAAIDAAYRSRTVGETLKAAEGHDDRIRRELVNGARSSNGAPPRPSISDVLPRSEPLTDDADGWTVKTKRPPRP